MNTTTATTTRVRFNPVFWGLLTLGQILLVMVGVLLSLAFLLYADRKIWASVQLRKGPNVVGRSG
jgi:NADH-quinone oxidoreductase subunit H